MYRPFFAAIVTLAITAVPAAAQDWNTPHIGILAGAYDAPGMSGSASQASLVAGYDLQKDTSVFGGGLELNQGEESTGSSFAVTGRYGYLLNPDLLLFGAVSAGNWEASGDTFLGMGAGAEYAMTGRLRLRGQVRQQFTENVDGTKMSYRGGVILGF